MRHGQRHVLENKLPVDVDGDGRAVGRRLDHAGEGRAGDAEGGQVDQVDASLEVGDGIDPVCSQVADEGVAAGAATEPVFSATTEENVIASAAIQLIGCRRSDQLILAIARKSIFQIVISVKIAVVNQRNKPPGNFAYRTGIEIEEDVGRDSGCIDCVSSKCIRDGCTASFTELSEFICVNISIVT